MICDRASVFFLACIFTYFAPVLANHLSQENLGPSRSAIGIDSRSNGLTFKRDPVDLAYNDFPLFRPPEIGNGGYKPIEVVYDYEPGISARAKKLPNNDKNWDDLVAMMNFYNDNWTIDTDYLTDYGCNCRGQLDRYTQGHGIPMGPLDNGCHIWKQCLRCAQALYGDECSVENIKYNVELKSPGRYECQNSPGTCRKAICECDLAFAQYIGAHAAKWEPRYWAIDMGGYTNFNTDQCMEPMGGNYKARCCANTLSDYLIMYDANKHCCDAKGFLQTVGSCEETASYSKY